MAATSTLEANRATKAGITTYTESCGNSATRRVFMKNMTKTIIGALLLGAFNYANADVVQVWECTLHDGKTGAELEKVSSAWLAAAKGMKGGSELKVYHEMPLAANAGEGGFNFVLTAPDAAIWGTFWNGYGGSAASKADEDWDKVADCSGSSLWNSAEVK
jgi:hypothetical protein